ncbi:MAG: serine hydrolase domain-containing protein [Candidatus Hodarchaeota archaeon]
MSRFQNLLFFCFFFIFIFPFFWSSSIIQSTEPEYWPTEDWLTSDPIVQEMNSRILNEIPNYIDHNNIAVDSILIIRNGYLVLEEYWNGYTKNSKHIIYSITKSVMSGLIGIALKLDYIPSLDTKIIDIFSDLTIENLDSRKRNITVKHLLTMTAGFQWNEMVSYFNSTNTFHQLWESSNWVEFILNRPMAIEPGFLFNYNSGASHLLSAIIQKTTGNSTLSFAMTHLFKPLGITDISWMKDPQGVYFGGSELRMHPRDLAKISYLYLNNGKWNGSQIIPSDYINQSLTPYIPYSGNWSYCYQWYTNHVTGMFAAVGWGGQRIYVAPDQNLMIIFTANLAEEQTPYWTLIYEYIIPSIEDFTTDISSSRTVKSVIVLIGITSLILIVHIRNKKKGTR